MKRAGYAGFSYADLAKDVGIRKASIHHHFPSKVDIATASVERYRLALLERLESSEARSVDDALDLLESIFVGAFEGPGGSCLCASLAGDWDALPEPVRVEVRRYWDASVRWLGGVVDDAEEARVLFALFEGAILAARIYGDPAPIRRATLAARRMLR